MKYKRGDKVKIRKDLLKIALRYIEKGYSYEDLSWGNDSYAASKEDKELCLSYYDDVQEQGTKWAYKQLEDE